MKKHVWKALAALLAFVPPLCASNKPVLHGKHWVAITGKPLAATAGSMIFQKGGNAVDAACAMLAATTTMFDTLSWGGETQALIFNPKTGKVIAVNALGVAPTGATPEFFHGRGMAYPPEYGPLAAVTPGTPGGLMMMLAEYGKLSLKDVLAPAMQLAEGYPIEQELADGLEREKKQIRQWPYSAKLFLTHPGEAREAPRPGEMFRQPDLLATLQKLVDAEQSARAAGMGRKEAIYAAYDRFYKGDIAQEFVRGSKEQGGLATMEDLAKWRPRFEEPVSTNYKDIAVYKLDVWTQGPAMLEALNLLEPMDLKGMGYNSARYIHALYQVMNLAFADRDFYYGDPDRPPRRAAPRAAVQGLRGGAPQGDRLDEERREREARRSVPVPEREEPVPGIPRAVEERRARPEGERGALLRGGLSRGHDVDRSGGRGGLGRLGDAVGRLESRLHRGKDGHRHEPAHAELRARSGRESVTTSSSPASARA